MKTKCILFTVVALLALTPVMALAADSLEGSIQGYSCVVQGKTCPVGQEDPLVAVETAFVLHIKGMDYYFVPNVDRAILARHINEMVKIEGVIGKNFKAIHASEMFVKKSGAWKKVWSSNMEDDIYRDVFGAFPLGGL